MDRDAPRPALGSPFLWLGVVAGLGYWVADAVVEALVLDGPTFREALLQPTPDNLWMRLFTMAVSIAFGACAQYLIASRQRRERALRDSERRFHAIFDQSYESIGLLSPDGTLLEANQTALEFVGAAPEAVVGRPFWETPWWPQAPDDQARLKGAIAGAAQGKVVRFETTHLGTHGRIATVDFSIKPVCDDDGHVVLLIPEGRDITGRIRTRQALRESRQMLQLVLDSIPVRVFWKDCDLVYLGCNRLFAEDAGLASPEEIIGKEDFELAWVEQAELYRADDREVIRTGVPKVNYEEPQTRVDGTELWLRTSKIPLRNADGDIIGVLGTYEDITERKRAEDALESREQRYRDLVETSNDLIWAVDANGCWTFVNQAARDIYGYEPEEMLGRPFTEFETPERAGQDLEIFDRLLVGEAVFQYETCHVRKDGTPVLLSFNAVTLRDDTGQVRGTTGTATDITERRRGEDERRRLQAQFFQAQKMEGIGTLAGGIAHDFNNLLTGVLGSLQLALMDLDPASSTSECLREAQEAAERAAELTTRLLTLSRRQPSVMSPTDLNEVVTRTARLLGRSIPETIEVAVSLEPRLPTIQADGVQLEQALLNLGINARDAMPEGGTLTFKTAVTSCGHDGALARAGEFASVTIADTGTGMPPEVVDHIFEPFFTTKGPGEGTGLGLAMVYGCVQAHDGWVTAVSSEGAGTTFELFLPLRAAEAEPEAPDVGELPRGKETVLLVDDTDVVVFLGRGVLERCGYTVLTAWNGEEALRVYDERGGDIALVVTDLVMPRCGGRDLLGRLRERSATVPVILTSGYATEARSKELLKEGFAAFVRKPFDATSLARTVRRVLDGAAANAGAGD